MKNLKFLAAALFVLLAACQKEETPQVIEQQQITVTIPGQDLTRAEDGDGTNVNRCILQVYKHDGEENKVPYGEKYYATVKDFKATFNLQLLTSQTYDFVFWADCVESTEGDAIKTDKNYNTADLTAITVNNYAGNNETFDAFTAVYKDFEVTGAFNISDVELIRPLGQVSVTTNDLSAIPDDKYKPDYVKVIFTDLPDSYNALTEEVSSNADAAEVSYTAAVKSTTGLLTVDYLFAAKAESALADFKIDFYKGNPAGTGATLLTSNSNFKNIPLRRNYQTKISGNLLTSSGQVEVTVTPGFTGSRDVEYIDGKLVVSTNKAIEAALVKDGNIILTQDLTYTGSGKLLTGEKTLSIDLNEKTFKLSGRTALLNSSIINVGNGATMTISNGTVDAPNFLTRPSSNYRAISIRNGGHLVLENVTIKSNNSAIGIETGAQSGTITIRNSVIEADYFGIATDASKLTSGVKVIIENSIIKSPKGTRTPIFWNVPCELSLTNCQIEGTMQGALVRGGNVTFKDCTITHKYAGSNAATDAAAYTTADWGSGNAVPLAAITLGNRSTSYQYATNLTLINTKVETYGADAALFPAVYAYANQTAELGVTFTYDSKTTFTANTGTATTDGKLVYGSENITVVQN